MATAPLPSAKLRKLAGRYSDPGKATALAMLAAGPPMREALREYEDRCVIAARKQGATWAEIGDALDMARQNVQRRFAHLDDARGTDRRSERKASND